MLPSLLVAEPHTYYDVYHPMQNVVSHTLYGELTWPPKIHQQHCQTSLHHMLHIGLQLKDAIH